jgi:hypothetical protein
LKHRKPKSAGESIQVVENIVNEHQAVDLNPSPLKRRIDEIERDLPVLKVKTERSVSMGSSLSETTSTSINVKMEVDEETSKAASILNGVSMDPRNVLLISYERADMKVGSLPSPMHVYPTPYCSQVDNHLSWAHI